MYELAEKNDAIKGMFTKTKLTAILLSENTTQEEFNAVLNIFGQGLSYKAFLKQNRGKFLFSKIFTPSDEAFLIFTLGRCWEPWYNEYVLKQGTSRKGRYVADNSNQRYAGFKEEGIIKFNRICEEVKKFRSSNKRKILENEYMNTYAMQGQVTENENVNMSTNNQSLRPKKRKIIAYTDIDFMVDERQGENLTTEAGCKFNMTNCKITN